MTYISSKNCLNLQVPKKVLNHLTILRNFIIFSMYSLRDLQVNSPVSLQILIILVTELWETPITVAICQCDLEVWLY